MVCHWFTLLFNYNSNGLSRLSFSNICVKLKVDYREKYFYIFKNFPMLLNLTLHKFLRNVLYLYGNASARVRT